MEVVEDYQLRSASGGQEVVEQDTIHPMDKTTCNSAAEDQEKVGSAENGDAPEGHAYGLGTSENGDAKDDQEAVEQCVIGKEFAAMDDTVMGGMYAAKDETSAEYQETNVEQCATYDSKNIMIDDAFKQELKAKIDFSYCPFEKRNHSVAEILEMNRSGLPILEEPIKITIIEKFDVVWAENQMKSSEICGKMVVKFRPEMDRLVDFLVEKLGGIGFTSYARVDRVFFNKFQVMRSERFPEGPFDLLKWYKKNAYIPLPLGVTTEIYEDPYYSKEHIGVNKNFVVVTCIPMRVVNMHNVVVTIPVPGVDHVGVARKTRLHVWKDRGTHVERDNFIEWHIPNLGASDKRAMMAVDAFCYDGWPEPLQFCPIRIEFSYEPSIASQVAYVVRSEDGREVAFQQETLGRCSYVINHQKELARLAAEAAEEALAWQQGPWEDE